MSERCEVVPSSDGRGRRGGAGVWAARGALALCVLAGSAGLGAPVASAGDNCPNAVIRAQRSQERLPNCRVYELVSPLDKTGADVGFMAFGAGVAGYSGASGDGNRMVFSTPSVAVGDAVRGIQFYATATRTAAGWKTVSTIPGPPPSVVGDFTLHFPSRSSSPTTPRPCSSPPPFRGSTRRCFLRSRPMPLRRAHVAVRSTGSTGRLLLTRRPCRAATRTARCRFRPGARRTSASRISRSAGRWSPRTRRGPGSRRTSGSTWIVMAW